MQNILQIQVGLRIKELRARDGSSQECFALKIGMDRTTYRINRSGPPQRHVAKPLRKIATGFDMTLSEFFEGITQPQLEGDRSTNQRRL